jgi:hypothetical protein
MDRTDHAMLANVFPGTLLHFTEHGLVIDLRRPLGREVRDQLAAIGLGGGFCVITADNPNGRTQSNSQNAAAMHRLREAIATLDADATPCDGTNPDRTHRERGLAARIDRARGIELGRAFEQIAIFHYDGDTFWLVPALAEGPARRLP